MKEIFEDIIHNHKWCDVLCGSGSTLAYTALLRQSLPTIIKRYGMTSMLDAPCGDFSWMSLVEFPQGFEYKGGDIVESMIISNRHQYPQIQFQVLDISQDTLPAVDMIFIRDCLIHLSDRDVLRVLDNICSSSVKYAMLTNYKAQHAQISDIRTGDFRPINMRANPFNLPEPLVSLDDGPANSVIKTMDLWSVEQIRGTR